MLQTTDKKPIAAARTPEATDFADRLGALTRDVRLIEMAAGGLRAFYNGPSDDICAIVMACRRLYGEIEGMADEVLPSQPEAERKRVGRGGLA